MRVCLYLLLWGFIGNGCPVVACTVPRPAFNPAREPANTILLGRVINEVGSPRAVTIKYVIGSKSYSSKRWTYRDARVDVRRVIAGRYAHKTYLINHLLFDGSGLCALGPVPKRGDILAIYLQQTGTSEPGLVRFLPLAEAMKIDRRVRTE